MVLDDSLVDENTSGPAIACIDKYRIICRVDKIYHETIRDLALSAPIEHKIGFFVGELRSRAIQVTDDACVLHRRRKEGPIIVGGADVVGFQIKA